MSLKIDLQALAAAQSAYAAQAQALDGLNESLNSAISELRTSWDSDAGKEFFSKFDDSFCKNLTLYTRVVEHMADNIGKATKEYAPLFEQAEQLKLEFE